MGCLFSSASPEEQGDRHRKDQQNTESTIPAPKDGGVKAKVEETNSPSLSIGRSPAAPNGAKRPGMPRILGTSITDNQQRETHNFQNLVQQARQAFIDISAQSQRVQVSPLSPQALSLTAQCEILLSSEMVPNIRNGFFESHVPFTVFSSVDTNPNSSAENSVDNIVNQILEPPNFQMIELAYACAQETCYALIEGTVQVVEDSLVITQAEFEDHEQ